MFERLIIDTSSYPLSQISDGKNSLLVQEMRMLSCFYLVSKEVVELDRDYNKEPNQLRLPFVDEDIWEPIETSKLLSGNTRYDCKDRYHTKRLRNEKFHETVEAHVDNELRFESYSLKTRQGKKYYKSMVRQSDLLLSQEEEIKTEFLSTNRKNAKTAILALAAAGVEIGLPRIKLHIERREEFLTAKSKLEEERLEYIAAITKYANEAYERLMQSPDIDTIMWAQDQAQLKIYPKVIELELAMKKLNKSILDRLKMAFIGEGVPALGSTLSSLDTPYQKSVVLHKMLDILSKELARERQERAYPEACYQVKLSKELKK